LSQTSDSKSTNSQPSDPPVLEITHSDRFVEWLTQEKISIAITTYQTGRLMLVGINDRGGIHGADRTFDRAMGLYATPDCLYLSTRYQLWKIENALLPKQTYEGFDKFYIPRIGYTTGEIDIHDVACDRKGRVIFVSTLLNCIATIDEHQSCIPLWKPPFISKIVPEDRCHLNSMALVDGIPRYVTAVSQTDVANSWRDYRQDGGCVIDVRSQEIILTGLSMPHSPRFHQNKLWVLNSGRGELGYVDMKAGKFIPVAFCPGYLRGLAFWGDWAMIGLSKPRDLTKTFSGLALDQILSSKGIEPWCAVAIVNLKSGEIEHWLRSEGAITELYDVQILAGVHRANLVGLQTEEICRFINFGAMQRL